MAARISALPTGVRTRLTARHLDGVRFRDNCVQLRDTTCRPDSRLRATETALAASGLVR
ncbi:hypothetical protein [Streptomyces longisporoflavus]|uniref:Uncharacterized protein n=1 Tax=Streptomyces longisporoflavus TaxID=28044 RepID=A0ABW7R083_9ACTN